MDGASGIKWWSAIGIETLNIEHRISNDEVGLHVGFQIQFFRFPGLAQSENLVRLSSSVVPHSIFDVPCSILLNGLHVGFQIQFFRFPGLAQSENLVRPARASFIIRYSMFHVRYYVIGNQMFPPPYAIQQ
jgi:hypothetical protein